MRTKGVLLWLTGGIVLVAVLAAANLALRPDPEPDFRPVAVRERGPTEPDEAPGEAPDGLRATPPEEARTAEEEASSPAPAERSQAAAVATDESEPSTLGCDHPFVPSAPGAWRRYRWAQSGEERAAELRIEALSARELENGDREITWQVEVTALDDRSELANERMTTRCTPGRDAEEPWFGILERSLSLRLTDEPRWRWPAQLRPGARFEGTAIFDPQGAQMRMPADVRGPQVLRVTRSHVVGERESVDVPSGRHRAWRVDFEERYSFGDRGEQGRGTAWVAPEVGMVKLRQENSRGVVQTIELVALGRRAG